MLLFEVSVRETRKSYLLGQKSLVLGIIGPRGPSLKCPGRLSDGKVREESVGATLIVYTA